jgi:hypothetical protein
LPLPWSAGRLGGIDADGLGNGLGNGLANGSKDGEGAADGSGEGTTMSHISVGGNGAPQLCPYGVQTPFS